ncbi:MAG TPA: hypothetical protein VF928_07575 [Usitatibacteraceae bacterium]
MLNLKTGVALAATAAALFAFTAPATVQAADKTDDVKCAGINSCKGSSDCKTAKNECKGHNACKGQGWVHKTAAECKAAGGSVLK